jgi:phosphoglycolate phosphatase
MRPTSRPFEPHAVTSEVALHHPSSGKPVRAVLFDLDGTLVDSAPDIAFAVNKVMAKDGVASHSVAVVRTLIGEGIHRLVEKAYALHHRGLSLDNLNARTAEFAALYEAHIADATRPYPGVITGLEALRNQGIKIAVVSNKAQYLTDHLLQTLGLASHFDLILGARDNLPKKPAPDMLQFALRSLGAGPDEAVFVGDSVADVRAAEAANLPCILIDGGYTVTPAEQLGAWRTASDFANCTFLLAGLLSGEGAQNAASTDI